MFIEIVYALIILYLIFYTKQYLKWRKEILLPMKQLPGLTRLPIIGTMYIYIGVGKEDLYNTYTEQATKMPDVFASWNGMIPEVNIKKPDHFEIIMNNSVHISKARMYQYLMPWLGEGLLTSSGLKWHQRRKLLTPAFHFKILENFMQVFVEKSNLLIQHLNDEADGKIFNVYPLITHCTLDIISETAMGVVINAMTNTESLYIKSIYGICELVNYRLARPYLIWDKLYYKLPKGKEFMKYTKYLHNYSRKVISDRKKYMEKNPMKFDISSDIGIKRKLSFLDLLLCEESLTLEDIREEVDTFMFEGHDTTTAGICWTLFSLGNYLEIQNKAFLEVQEVLGEKNVPTTLAELSQLKYLECVIKEALRLYPSVPIIGRTTTTEVHIDKYRIPPGVQVALHIHYLHRDPENFPNPEKFDPDRFLPENCIGRHPFSYIPFSAGPRNCIGQKFAMYEEKTILSSIIKNFEIKSVDKPEDVKIQGELILRPNNGIKLTLKRRKT